MEMTKLYGSEFAQNVFKLDAAQWIGHIASQYGLHLGYVIHKSTVVNPEIASVTELVTSIYIVSFKICCSFFLSVFYE